MDDSPNAPLSAAPRQGTIGRRGAAGVAVASLLSAGVGYVVLAVAARVLVPGTVNSVFVTFWSTLFACFGVLSGLSIETTRAVTAASTTADTTAVSTRPRILAVGLGIGVGAAVVLAASAPLWAPRLFPTDSLALAGLVCLGVAAYAAHSVVIGALAGRHSWTTYSRLIAAESTVRLVLVLAAAALGARVLGFAAGTAVAACTWVAVVAVSPRARTAAAMRADSSLPVFLRRIAAAALATGASALLLVGFPMLLSLTTSTADYAASLAAVIAISWTRAPLMIPLTAYQGVAVSHFVLHRDRGLRALAPVVRAVALVGAVGSVLAYLVGPWIMVTVLGPTYVVSGALLAGLTGASAALALLTLTGALCQALTMHRVFAAGWLTALAVAVAILVLPLGLETRSILALSIGPSIGIAVHLRALLRAPARTVPTSAAP